MLGEASAAGASDPSSDLWDNLDQMANAEPLDAEEDLVLRMAAVSSLRKSTPAASSSAKYQKRSGKASLFSPSKVGGGIAKQRRQPARTRPSEGMQVDSVSVRRSRPESRASHLAAAAAMAVAKSALPPPIKMKRSHSI